VWVMVVISMPKHLDVCISDIDCIFVLVLSRPCLVLGADSCAIM
jgi:hypothetical protein